MAITDRMAAWRRERRVLRSVSRAAWRLEQAERNAPGRWPWPARGFLDPHAGCHGSVHSCTAAPRTLARPPELPDERLIARREREVPDQLSAGRLGKPAQLSQLIL